MVKSYASALDLKDDKVLIEEYKKYHQNVWPEVKNSLLGIGILEMKIYLLGNHLFMYYETNDSFDPQVDFQRYATDNPKTSEWDNLMRKFQQKLKEAKPTEWWASMEQVFDLTQ
ncbi:hypothetical protein DFA_03544 [Cavenderia fasciculata]|uniref:L-rhamnose mutarotase n=1 Tax=Cavenderia fasciculata TaxID=261658 RepID=F4PHW1_CACFS|nr:uncharacterized protein DFA_03544 [Cavenderia fasciculata]EGG25295.1 hypothetical protein DFA_03544 [Cavenderia fasciculata]|eukprot:XP_004363146.1 hypothetical protein DFA_03544 [Cavenderia fasciculata]